MRKETMKRIWISCFAGMNLKFARRNRKSAILVGAMLSALGSSAAAQQPGKIFRIGYFDSSTASGMAVRLEVFRQELRKLGWIEGKDLTIEYRFAEGKNDRMPEFAAELVRLKVDLIVVSSAVPALAAKKATTAIPIVMTSIGDPVVCRSDRQSGPLSARGCLRGQDLERCQTG
jgi:putative tryptophan/tyrosine transport system substrate-binding protein